MSSSQKLRSLAVSSVGGVSHNASPGLSATSPQYACQRCSGVGLVSSCELDSFIARLTITDESRGAKPARYGHPMGNWDLLAGLEVQIDGYDLEGRCRIIHHDFNRMTSTFVLQGGGEEGRGEDVCYWPTVQQGQLDRGPYLPLEGTFTLAEFSEHVAGLDLFPTPPHFPADDLNYRRWALESAAADLALRQAGTTLHELLGRPLEPVRFIVSFSLGDPPSLEPITRRLASYPELRFKVDAVPAWLREGGELLEALAETGTLDAVDFKGTYEGTPVDVETDPEFYRRCAEALRTSGSKTLT